MKKKKKHSFYDPNGLDRYRLKWTQKEEDLLRKMYPDTFNKELEEYFGRTERAIGAKAKKMRIRKKWRKHDPSLVYDRKPWSKKEKKLLRKLYPTASNEDLAKYFPKRKVDAIGKQANLLGLRKKYLNHFERPNNYDPKLWRKQKDLLIKLYPTTDNEKLAEMLGRTKAAITNLAWKMGLHKEGYKEAPRTGGNARLWSKKEDALIKKLYPTVWTKNLAVKLGRSENATINRAIMLGVRKKSEFTRPPRPEDWSAEDIKKVRELWEQGYIKAEIARMVGKTVTSTAGQIQRQIRDFGLQKRFESKAWSKKDDSYLIKHCKTKQLSIALVRTVHTVRNRISFLNLTRRKQ